VTVTIHQGDCRDALAGLPADSVDSVVTDPPYHLLSTVKRFAKTGGADRIHNGDCQYGRLSRGFMGKSWDGGDIAFRPETWAAVLRVLKPGGHMVAFSAPKNVHRLTCAIEDAGFEIRDALMWLFGTGFPKSHDVALTFETQLCEQIENEEGEKEWRYRSDGAPLERGKWRHPDAIDWQGWGTALKPAYEPIVLARKPLIGTVAANVLAHGTGAINVDGCRVDGEPWKAHRATGLGSVKFFTEGETPVIDKEPHALGRWPANIIHDGSEEVLASFPDAPGQIANASTNPNRRKTQNVYGAMRAGNGRAGEPSADRRYTENGSTNFAAMPGQRRGDSGSAARFFYCAKASKADRNGSKHPTVKPIALMRYLARLITPPGGTILDPFAGSGTTGQAAIDEGFNVILIEKEDEYIADIRRRFGDIERMLD
jgi:site-specific DNA-methyltransferase (adenine-specific)